MRWPEAEGSWLQLSREEFAVLLGGIYLTGIQTDGYAAYDRVGGAKMVHAACWNHARTHFVDAVKLDKQDSAFVRARELINN